MGLEFVTRGQTGKYIKYMTNLIGAFLHYIYIYLFENMSTIYIALYTVEPAYNDIGLYDTSSIASDILWYQLIPHC